MKVALVYDRVNKWGGAERVLLSLQKLFPTAPLYTAVYNRKGAAWADAFTVKPTYLQSLPFAKAAHEYYPLLMPSAFESIRFDIYDLVISVTSEAAKGIITKPETKHICYCLTPTRYLWSGYDEYFSSPVIRKIAAPAVSYLRRWDIIAAQRPDSMIAISHEVRKRIKRYYARDVEVFYPPLTLNNPKFKIRNTKQMQNTNYFLVVSRLVPYKHVDLTIQACNELALPLVVVGTGSEEKKLRALAGPTVTFAGSVTDEALAAYYEGCSALLFPGEEDFGLTVIEAASFGKPVIAYKKGGVIETVIDGKTGMFFHKQTKDALRNVLRTFHSEQFSAPVITRQAEKFSEVKFQKALTQQITAEMNT